MSLKGIQIFDNTLLKKVQRVMNEKSPRLFKFGPFILNPMERLLTRHDEAVPLNQKAFETLLVLVQNRGRVLEKEELLKTIWPDTFIEEGTLAQNIYTLRKALGLTEDGRQYIDTVPRRGYRFAGNVQEQANDNTLEPGEFQGVGRLISQALQFITKDRKAQHSLAILPLVNMTSDSSIDYLCDGITDNIIKSLSGVSGLHVVARSIVFRYKGEEVNPQEVGNVLGVRAVMVGRIHQIEERFVIQA